MRLSDAQLCALVVSNIQHMKILKGCCLTVLLFFHFSIQPVFSQCSSYPVPLKERVSRATYIAQGKVISKRSYIDEASGRINTLNGFVVNAWLKNASAIEEVYVITLGGVVGNKAMLVEPSLQLDLGHEYVLMLESDNRQADDKQMRSAQPATLQVMTFADEQGSLTNQGNNYYDKHYPAPKNEFNLFTELSNLTHESAKSPQGNFVSAREATLSFSGTSGGGNAVSSFSPATAHGGTVVSGDQVTINGSGFGATKGTVFFANADDGGATYAGSGIASDIISWSDNSIVVKTASMAGSGRINVNGSFVSATNLNVPYSHTCINTNFSGFSADTRQRYNLVNKNGTGGYTYIYNSAFASNTAAVAAFERSLFTWRCTAGVNLERSAASSALTTAARDGVNLVLFDATLPAGVLGRATSYFYGSASNGCQMANTVWWLDELDMQFCPDPPTAGYTWQYGPSLPSGLQYDFESVASHEIGHHMGLAHVIAPGQLMHFALSNGSSLRTLSGNDLDGISAKLSYSNAPLCFTPGTVSGPMAAPSGGCVLPVKLTDFTGFRKNENANQLQWHTSQENSNRGFYAERSRDGVTFSDIAFVNGVGNTTAATGYSYPDNTAGSLPFYYRLRQVDVDGRSTYSNIIFIDGSKKSGAKTWANDAGNKLFIYLSQPPATATSVILMNAQGQQILQKRISSTVNELEVGFLSKGIYFYKMQHNGETFTGRVMLGQ